MATLIIPECADTLRVRSLYRYQDFNLSHLEELILKGRIKFSNPHDFNDPWDCRPTYTIPTDMSERERVIQSFYASHQKHSPHLARVRDAELRKMRSQIGYLDSHINKLSDEMWRAIGLKYRVYCLAESREIALMWSHYSNKHQGICIEFDSTMWPFAAAMQVRYSADYPKFSAAVEGDVLGVLLAKSADWKYEREFRLIADEQAPHGSVDPISTRGGFTSIPPSRIKSITVGSRTSADSLDKLKDIVAMSGRSIPIFRAYPASNRYAVLLESV